VQNTDRDLLGSQGCFDVFNGAESHRLWDAVCGLVISLPGLSGYQKASIFRGNIENIKYQESCESFMPSVQDPVDSQIRSVIKIFISYSHEDKAVVEKLAKQLESRGYEVWWDNFLIAGQDYRGKTVTQLVMADKVIVVWSSHSVRSSFVIDEAQRAHKLRKLIPIVIDVSDIDKGT